MHACIQIGNARVMLTDEQPKWRALGPKALNGTPVSLHLYVEDADSFAQRAVDAGAKLVMPVADMFWGDRYGQVEDPFGHRWSVATHVKDMTAEEIKKAVQYGVRRRVTGPVRTAATLASKDEHFASDIRRRQRLRVGILRSEALGKFANA